ncbi:NAC domain-containing protein 41-like [Pyrus x bretschneideri]|uniref:NAC domain-containing protein 41-like n=1 Tax=Pyrus x bretschneideri TaxID=225117 RepID=UPI0020303E25|nr:NAC domain-containing protein 41-like [Pyrus x bretschneideri]
MAGYYQVPVGYRFMPRDDELLLDYLRPKLDGQDYPKGIVHDCDLYGLEEPSDIWRRLNRASHEGHECTDDKDIYVFTTLNLKAPNGSRFCRTVGTTGGTWKGEDAGKKIYASGIKHAIGFRKRFTYRIKGSPQNDHWIMHEFHLDPSLLRNKHHQEKNIVLCILRRKDDISKKRKLEERDNYEENAANHFQPQALNAINVGDYNNAPIYMEQIAFDHSQPLTLTATTIGDYNNDPRYPEENAANHFQPQEFEAATTGDYSNAHWYTEHNAADHFEPHDEAHNATNEALTTALKRMEEILMSGFRG